MNALSPLAGGHPEVSVVIPTFNEEENVEAIANAVAKEVEGASASYEIIIIDNASTDRTVELVRAMAARDPHIRLIVNARNFGQMRSPTHGIYCAKGRGVINMCADFQDPPGLIGELIARWRNGAKIVLAVRESEKGSMVKRAARAIGYGFLRQFADYPVIPNATGFGIYDRAVVDCLSKWNEPEPFFRGMLVESGFGIETISYPRAERAAGKSKNNLLRLAGFMLSGIAASSKKLLRLPFALAIVAFIVTGCTLVVAAISAILGGPVLMWLVLSLIELQFAFLFSFIGLIGDQVRLISERTRNFPLVIEKERVNFDSPDP